MSGSISSNVLRYFSNKSDSLLTGITSLPCLSIVCSILLSLSRIIIFQSSNCLSQRAIEVTGLGAFLIYSGVSAPPISISISKNTSLWVT